ncbi:hypothetical protein FOCG_13600 [Fusarium oxysporum f. sp. radicis-lycopersici 26381]|nr:hypothetical protein FOWG_09339 [Fusarium oxysporum f. sp. lycopersici MN25]EXL44654.1 hypothetical protein FOCG_13600 [Fusarium oxysporum f. sp. radicis-lycopersici 26381]
MRQLVFNRVRKIVKSIVLLDSRGFIVVIDLHETARSSVTVHRKATVPALIARVSTPKNVVTPGSVDQHQLLQEAKPETINVKHHKSGDEMTIDKSAPFISNIHDWYLPLGVGEREKEVDDVQDGD